MSESPNELQAPGVAKTPRAVINSPGRRRLAYGHPWIYRDDIKSLEGAEPGDVVTVLDNHGHLLGRGFYSGASRIAIRLLTREDVAIDLDFWRRRVHGAVDRRDSLPPTTARRLIHAEADGFPALVVDQYARVLSVQATSLATERLLPTILEMLQEKVPDIDTVVLRHDVAVRRLEGLAREVRLFSGELDGPIEVDDDGVTMVVDVLKGQKTGLYLDQRENRRLIRSWAKGRRVLDAFCYQGGFGLAAAKAGASEVVCVDSSAEALERGERSKDIHGLEQVRFVRGKVFDLLRDYEKASERFDIVLLDPPAFAKSRRDVPAARRAYREINRRGMSLLTESGLLATSSCSYNMTESLFGDVVGESAVEARQSLHAVERGRQAADHPVLLGHPESHYLKTLFLRRVEGL